MYNINELFDMDDATLKSVAESLGIKKFKPEDRESVVYQILDEQAIKSAAENASTQAGSKRRGRKTADDITAKSPKGRRKTKAAETADNAETQAVDAPEQEDAVAPEQEVPAKRTRKGKKTDDAVAEAPAQPAEKKRRGRKAAAKAVEAATEVTAALNAPDEPSAEASETKDVPVAADVDTARSLSQPSADERHAVEAATVPPTADDTVAGLLAADNAPRQQNQPKKRDFRASNNSTFSSFFAKSEGKRFVPRSQQEREQAAAAAAAAPIVIAEPVAAPAPKAKKGKKAKNQAAQAAPATPAMPIFKFDDIIESQGVLEIVPEGYGFLRSSDYNYLASPDDIYVTQQQIKEYGLRQGDVVECTVRAPRESDKYFPMSRVLRVNGRSPEFIRDRHLFEHLTPLFPDEKFDITSGRTANLSTRVVDMFAPIGKGQRALIVAPPKTGKTILLKDIANAIAENHPETYIMILLIDERPEEVTDMMRSVNAEVIASTFDEPAENHVKISQIVLDKAKRMVECGHDVVILLDSITRLARAYNTVAPASGKILSGGVDANALQRPKRFFGAARNIENGGSLTIIATALTETSSRMDEVIFEEFKGTGNMELQLDRKLSNKRIFPAVDITASSTRRDDLLLRPETLNRMWILRRFLGDRTSLEAMEFIKDRMERTVDNDELLRTMGD